MVVQLILLTINLTSGLCQAAYKSHSDLSRLPPGLQSYLNSLSIVWPSIYEDRIKKDENNRKKCLADDQFFVLPYLAGNGQLYLYIPKPWASSIALIQNGTIITMIKGDSIYHFPVNALRPGFVHSFIDGNLQRFGNQAEVVRNTGITVSMYSRYTLRAKVMDRIASAHTRGGKKTLVLMLEYDAKTGRLMLISNQLKVTAQIYGNQTTITIHSSGTGTNDKPEIFVVQNHSITDFIPGIPYILEVEHGLEESAPQLSPIIWTEDNFLTEETIDFLDSHPSFQAETEPASLLPDQQFKAPIIWPTPLTDEQVQELQRLSAQLPPQHLYQRLYQNSLPPDSNTLSSVNSHSEEELPEERNIDEQNLTDEEEQENTTGTQEVALVRQGVEREDPMRVQRERERMFLHSFEKVLEEILSRETASQAAYSFTLSRSSITIEIETPIKPPPSQPPRNPDNPDQNRKQAEPKRQESKEVNAQTRSYTRALHTICCSIAVASSWTLTFLIAAKLILTYSSLKTCDKYSDEKLSSFCRTAYRHSSHKTFRWLNLFLKQLEDLGYSRFFTYAYRLQVSPSYYIHDCHWINSQASQQDSLLTVLDPRLKPLKPRNLFDSRYMDDRAKSLIALLTILGRHVSTDCFNHHAFHLIQNLMGLLELRKDEFECLAAIEEQFEVTHDKSLLVRGLLDEFLNNDRSSPPGIRTMDLPYALDSTTLLPEYFLHFKGKYRFIETQDYTPVDSHSMH